MLSNRPPAATESAAWALDALAAPALAILFFLAAWRFYPHDAFSQNWDEGFEAMKGLLVDHRYRLYDQIWDDQPPLFTHVLRLCFHLFGAEIAYGRMVVLAFAAVLVCAVYDLVRRSWNHLAALAAVLTLVVSAHFLPLSVSVMNGIPSLACAMLSVRGLVRWRQTGRERGLLTSALLMSASLGIKLFTAFLVPVCAAWLLSVSLLEGSPRPWQPMRDWLVAVAVATAAMLWILVGPAGLPQIIVPHVLARDDGVFSDWTGVQVLKRIAPADAPLVLLAALGTLQIVVRRCWDLALLPLWAAVALVCLLPHAPVWHHHYLLLTIPAAPCAGVAIAELFAARRRGDDAEHYVPMPAVARVTGGLALLLYAFTLPLSFSVSTSGTVVGWDSARDTLATMQRFASATNLVLTDSPIYAFRAGFLTVPNLAVVSTKRQRTGQLTSAELVGDLTRLAPEQVLLTGQFVPATTDALLSAMGNRYAMIFSPPGQPSVRLFVRNDVVEPATRQQARASP